MTARVPGPFLRDPADSTPGVRTITAIKSRIEALGISGASVEKGYVATKVAPGNVFNRVFPAAATRAGLQAAIDSLGVTRGTVHVLSSTALSDADVTVPANVKLIIEPGVLFTGARGLVIHGEIDAARSVQVFSGPTVTFANFADVSPHWWGAKGDGSTDDYAALQAAINSLTDGGVVRLLAGDFPLSHNLAIRSSAVRLQGAGKQSTVLDASAINLAAEAAFATTKLWNGGWGIVLIAPPTPGTSADILDVSVADLTIRGNADSPGTNDGGGHAIVTSNVEGLTLTGIKVDTTRKEGVEFFDFDDGGAALTKRTKRVRVRDCDFFGTGYTALNSNDIWIQDVVIQACHFELCRHAIQMVGDNIAILGNTFRKIRNLGICVYESNLDNYGPDTAGVTISGNVFEEQGYGRTDATEVTCIWSYGARSQFVPDADYHAIPGTAATGVVISGNVILNTQANQDADTFGMKLIGNFIVSDNFISGLIGTHNAACTAFYIAPGPFLGASGTQRVYLNHNVVERNGDSNYWNSGISVQPQGGIDTTGVAVICTGNHILGVITHGFYSPVATPSDHPFVSFCGDTFYGFLRCGGRIIQNSGYDYFNVAGELNDVPLFGSTDTCLTTPVSRGMRWETLSANSATPSVAGASIFQAANSSPTTITNLTGGVPGQQVTLILDANTTVTAGTYMKIGVDIAGADKTLTLMAYDVAHGTIAWYEIGRKG